MPVPWHTRVRILVLEKIAAWLRVPMTVHHETMTEYRQKEIQEYLCACEELFGRIVNPDKLPDFHEWATQYLFNEASIHDPFLLHLEPIDFVVDYLKGETKCQENDSA